MRIFITILILGVPVYLWFWYWLFTRNAEQLNEMGVSLKRGGKK